MYADAEQQRDVCLEQNEQDGGGVLFKIRRDPRVTPVGRWIRQTVDRRVAAADQRDRRAHVARRAATARRRSTRHTPARRGGGCSSGPGITGLWQVSGRSELSWDDAVRLDLYYVENWSLGLDISILMRTIFAVASPKGSLLTGSMARPVRLRHVNVGSAPASD